MKKKKNVIRAFAIEYKQTEQQKRVNYQWKEIDQQHFSTFLQTDCCWTSPFKSNRMDTVSAFRVEEWEYT